jgi:hypothetical protein
LASANLNLVFCLSNEGYADRNISRLSEDDEPVKRFIKRGASEFDLMLHQNVQKGIPFPGLEQIGLAATDRYLKSLVILVYDRKNFVH